MSRWCGCEHCTGTANPVNPTRVAVHEIMGRAALSAQCDPRWPDTQEHRDFARLWEYAFANIQRRGNVAT